MASSGTTGRRWDWRVWESEFRRFTRPRASTRGLRRRSTWIPIRGPARRGAGSGRLKVMNTTSAYIVNAILVLLVVRQIREHRMDLRGPAGPVLAVGAAAVFFLRSVPAGGNDLLLELACVAAGAVMGCLSGHHGAEDRRDRSGARGREPDPGGLVQQGR
jgi:hypothetical protein